ncbi:FlgM family anti-sigma-28 factor [Scopulibacillus darangshiensis]|uniref:Negative regulator of flagellin synthesis n=1 Tax=Scopulibacillus darangshiensis TaxID=442528 RepID=A0A4R2NVP4_9BACL|nr:flagellar biosynthesis anti-sigma factor FlgM [Scopulibacillus darangshiensis]TCP26027.1 FlgM family anti-sigma-28 factor [Scopulibacillus darangshiensis]
MKINGYQSIHKYQSYQHQQQNKTENAAGQPKSQNDKVEISAEAKHLQTTLRLEQERKEKIEKLKQQVESGGYKMNHEETAKKMLAFWNR